MRLLLSLLIGLLWFYAATDARAELVTFDYTGTVNSVSGIGGPSIGSTLHASITVDNSVVGTPFLPGIVDHFGAVVGFSIGGVSYSADASPGASLVRMFDNFVQGSKYLDGMYATASTPVSPAGASVIFLAYVLNGSSSPSSLFTSTDIPTAPFDPLAFSEIHSFSYHVFYGDDLTPLNVSVSLSSVELTAAVPELSTWSMMLLGFAGIGFVTYRHRSPIRIYR